MGVVSADYAAFLRSLPADPVARVLAVIERYTLKSGGEGCNERILKPYCQGFQLSEVLAQLKAEKRISYRRVKYPSGRRDTIWRVV